MIKSILIIDDSIADHFLYKEVIHTHDADIEVFQAYDGHEGIEMLEEQGIKPDLILLDINMPGMNGFEFLETFETKDNLPQSVIIMLTSSGLQEDREKASGYDSVKDYILKPLRLADMDELLKVANAHKP